MRPNEAELKCGRETLENVKIQRQVFKGKSGLNRFFCQRTKNNYTYL